MKEIDINKIHKYDARDISKLIDNPIIDVTITSPPYFDMKDYGYTEQIGFGQNYENYLEDLRKVFEGVYACTKNTGSLWVIIDTFRRAGSVVPLPFDFANKIAPIGWKLQEIIIWGKDKTVPWAHNGQMRNLFEYILVFSKTDNYKFFIDKVRQYDSLKKWWVKYPERYNPKGKTPEAIWNFPIPVQGSWGENYIRHFCPLPEELIAQILKLTTEEEDLVLDPFAGSGAVLAKADNMKRKFIGTELNPLYIQMFQNYMDNTLSLSKIANALFVNSSYLSHLFKQESGSNLSDYLTRVRLDKAKRLLDDNQAQYSLSSIAGMVGYKDEYYFNKCFKKLYGISPKKYVEHK
mgnify:CR=1 FL=1